MNVLAFLRVATTSLWTNALRSVLAMLGIIIGVASVIVMVSIGAGARQAVEERIQSLGANQLVVTTGGTFFGRRPGAGAGISFDDGDVAAIRDNVGGVLRVSGVISGQASLIVGGVNWTSTIVGGHEDYLEVRNWKIADGRNFSPDELRGAAKVAVLGATAARELFGEDDPVGASVRIRNVPFTVLGVLEAKGQSGPGADQDDIVVTPITTARRRLFGGGNTKPNRVGSMVVQIDAEENIAPAQADIEDLLRVRRRVQPGERDSFAVNNMAEFIRARAETQNTLRILLAFTAAISLVVGGIGIMNIMLVSVTERTREIGVRMAVGARRRDILGQFLVEAVTLCLFGGLAGLAIGVAGTIGIAMVGAWPVAIQPDIVAIAILSSVAVGVFFGFYPARRASQLNPIDALRYE